MMIMFIMIMIENGWEGGLYCVTHTMAATWIGWCWSPMEPQLKRMSEMTVLDNPTKAGGIKLANKTKNKECTNCLEWYYLTQIVRQTLSLIELSLWTAEKLSNLTFKIQMILKSPAPESQIEQGIECNLLLLQSKMSRSCRKKIDEYH